MIPLMNIIAWGNVVPCVDHPMAAPGIMDRLNVRVSAGRLSRKQGANSDFPTCGRLYHFRAWSVTYIRRRCEHKPD
jgi:hypothetical protein